MARHKDYDAHTGRREAKDEAAPREAPDPLRAYRPLRKSGPASTLREEMILPLAEDLARGLTYGDAAARQGVSDGALKQWLIRGREAAAKGESNLYTQLLVEVENALAHYRAFLLEQGHASIADRGMSDKFVRWRLAVSAPKDFTVPAAAPAAGGSIHPAFELVSPEQALASLGEKIDRFLKLEEKAAEAANA